MVSRGRVWNAGRYVVLVWLLVATYVVFFAVSMRVASKAREVVVPSLKGRTVNEATELLTEQGLALRVEETRRLDPRIPAGHVVLQEPPAGSTAKRQRSVKVWLSEGATATVIPALVGESERTAQIRVQMAALQLQSVAEVRTGDYPAGIVVAQAPAPQSRGTAVSLLVNRGEAGARFIMPDLIGVSGDAAADYLRGRGFRVAVVGDQPYPGVAAGVVLRQRPQAGFQVSPGEAISLEVSR